tara:strand:- start:232 stop:420 length:189 start_codon:yes stop_codon:yes gene_type:complete
MKKLICSNCLSDQLVFDAQIDQDNNIVAVLDNCTCNNCGKENSQIENKNYILENTITAITLE